MIFVDVVNTQINLNIGFEFIKAPTQGAINTFLGVVRNKNFEKKVKGISYDVHKTLAIQTITKICQENKEKIDPMLRQFVVHHHGYLNVGQLSIAILVSAPHRKEAFLACRNLIEKIKTQAPIWKKEFYETGESEWVKGHALCQH